MNFIERVRRAFDRSVVDLLLLFVGTTATYLSVKYTFEWHLYTGDPFLEALGFSLVVVLFSVIIFEFAVQEWREGKRRTASIFFVMWFIVAVYSMQTTVAGQYIGVKTKELEALEASQEQRTAVVMVESLNERIRILDESAAGYQERKAQLLTMLSGITTMEERYEWKNTSANAEAELDEITRKLEALSGEKLSIMQELEKAKVTAKIEELKGTGTDVFAFYAEVLHLESTRGVAFALAVFRGVILDTINILCFMFVMIRRGRTVSDPLNESEPVPVQERKGTLELAELGADPKRRNRAFPGSATAHRLGVGKEDYLNMCRNGQRSGALVYHKGVFYRNPDMGKEDFLRGVLTGE